MQHIKGWQAIEGIARLQKINEILLEACKDLMDNWPAYWIVLPSWPKEYQKRLDALKAAIAKATEAEGK